MLLLAVDINIYLENFVTFLFYFVKSQFCAAGLLGITYLKYVLWLRNQYQVLYCTLELYSYVYLQGIVLCLYFLFSLLFFLH